MPFACGDSIHWPAQILPFPSQNGQFNTFTCLAYTQVDELIEYVKANSEI